MIFAPLFFVLDSAVREASIITEMPPMGVTYV